MSHPVPTVGVVCLRGEEVLLIKRGTPPRLGQWSVPGGRLDHPVAVRRQGFIQRPHDTARIQLVLLKSRARFTGQLIQSRGRPMYRKSRADSYS